MTTLNGLILANICLLSCILICLKIMINKYKINQSNYNNLLKSISHEVVSQSKEQITNLREFLISSLFKEHLSNTQRLEANVKKELEQFKSDLNHNLLANNTNINQQIDKMNSTLYQQLKDVRNHLDNSLTTNLSQTNETFTNIIKRLTLIDAAQKRIGELSTSIVNLQDVLSDKQCRGVFGEVQLATIVKNIIPAGHFKLQYTLSNSKRADCILLLPEPTGKLVIDSKFPLESFRAMSDNSKNEFDQSIATKQFKKDIRKHILDISTKYIIQDETSDCAIMFIPAESVFAEIHSHHQDLVDESFKAKVWMVSPTTMMAILNTSTAVIKDLARQKEIHLIQKHLNMLSQDFSRFQKRMDSLSKHIRQANEDVDNVNASAKKIVNRFDQIEKVEIRQSVESENEIIEKISI